MVNKRKYVAFILMLVIVLSACGKDSTNRTALTPKSAIELATAWVEMENIVMAGGLYKESEYTTFMHKHLNYRYLAGHLDSKKKLNAEIRKFVTKKKAKRFIRKNGIIKYEKKLAQPETEDEEESLLIWEIATAREMKSKGRKMTFELTVPIGDTRTAEKFTVNYIYVKKAGWRIDKFNE
ncbi:DL-endopeptidase inhibitor IseA family protein [Sporosarcina thermotolerans]|uniref:DL-endopeptidase inhibitor IseA family protein n=1 Tax=Sporosarcina thermotolerans TaxID=633404 RepID=A0AAW9AB78_9BACL|nr:DL-endopeptidase inhibitor IseA family protein [Sporosarcina thermotolerans]MDW0116856.1 DL-endopeptidase inhibitor IseA family protein [Sporosarcina thermotolerans]WHT48009.1 DL-endopeptidase inhibitor IseA family protein [Sporosarcina thermotolerans]